MSFVGVAIRFWYMSSSFSLMYLVIGVSSQVRVVEDRQGSKMSEEGCGGKQSKTAILVVGEMQRRRAGIIIIITGELLSKAHGVRRRLGREPCPAWGYAGIRGSHEDQGNDSKVEGSGSK